MKLLLIDNYDSFTYNLAQIFGELGADVLVKRNDETGPADIRQFVPERICISPGPGRPRDAGVSCDVIREFGPQIPCLLSRINHRQSGSGHRLPPLRWAARTKAKPEFEVAPLVS